MRVPLLLTILASLAACSVTQEVDPVQLRAESQLCIIENPAVREGFLEHFKQVLRDKGVDYRILAESSSVSDCELTATYLARWSWDFTIYMSYAEIKVYRGGALDGEAIYDSRGGSMTFGKFIDAEPKIRELVDQLLQQQSALLLRRSTFA